MEVSLQGSTFLDSFEELWSRDIDSYNKNKLNLFLLRINANEFNYDALITNLVEPLIDFAVSKQIKEKYKNKPGTLSRTARERFVDYCTNNGELGELLLFCFLESHLKAPKILTKMELKTSTKLFVNGADGVHFLKLPTGNYQLIFGESKTIGDLTSALTDAFVSISNFKLGQNRNGTTKSGLAYEKSLISENLCKETFSKEDADFLESLIYPKKEQPFQVDDAFGIFIGFEITISPSDKAMPSDDFREKVKILVSQEVEKRVSHITNKISELDLQGHNFYIYVLPFTDLDKKRKQVLEGIIK